MSQDDERAQSPLELARAGDMRSFRSVLDAIEDDDLVELTDELEAEKLFAAAESVYRLLIERNPEDPDQWANLGYNLYYLQRDAERADAHYLEGIERFPKSGDLKVARGVNLVFGLGRFEDAVVSIEAAVKSKPKNSWYRAVLAWCLLGMGRTAEGLDQARRARELLDDDDSAGGERIECNTFIYLSADEAERKRVLREIARDFQDGSRVEGGDFDLIIRRARENGHPEAERLVALTKVLCGEAPADGLSGWRAWQLASRSFDWPEDVDVPASLNALGRFAGEQDERFSGTFELERDKTLQDFCDAAHEAARDLAVFGAESDGALYALWLVPTRDPERAPVAYLSRDDPDDSRLLAANLRDFFALLGLCLSDLGSTARPGGAWAEDALAARAEEELSDAEEAFRGWLANELDLAPPSARAAEALVNKTLALSAPFATWIANLVDEEDVDEEDVDEEDVDEEDVDEEATPAPGNELHFDWSKLTHVYGSATDVPAKFLELLGSDETCHTDAMNDLVSCLYHQKDVTDATAAFVLMSGEELKRGHAARRPSALLDLLALFASAAESFDPNDDATADQALEKVLRGEPIVGKFGSMNTSEAADAVWAALQRVIPLAEPFLTREDCITEAARFVARMGSHASALHSSVTAALDQEPEDEAARATLLAALSATGAWPDADITARLRAALGDEADEVRAVAAISLVERLGSDVDSSVIDVLASLDWDEIPDVVELQTPEDVASSLGEKATAFLYAVLRQSQTFRDAVSVLCKLAERVTGRYVDRGSSSGRDKSGVDYVELTGTPTPPNGPLSTQELEFWSVVAATDLLWTGRTNLFELLGMQSNRAALAALTQR